MFAIASGDLHVETDGARSDECLRILDFITDAIAERRPDVYLCTGDVYHKASSPMDRLAAANHFLKAADVCPVVIVRGNHDNSRDLELIGKLKGKHPIIVQERAAVHYVGGAAIGAMAWPSRSSLAAMLGRPLGAEAIDAAAREALREVLRGMAATWEDFDGPTILLGHFMCDGSVTSTGQPLIGSELSVGTADLDLAQAAVVVMGHIHKPQVFDEGTNCPKYYCGSPFRTAFGETEEKSILGVHFDGPKLSRVERIVTPAKQMLLATGEWRDGQLIVDGADADQIEPGAEVRFRFSVPSDQREQVRIQAGEIQKALLAAGASVVKLDEKVETHTRAREGAEAVSQAVSLEDKLKGYWKLKNNVPSEARRARLFGKLGVAQEKRIAS